MVSKRLMLAWAFFDFCLLAAGIITVALSFIWRQPDVLLNLTFNSFELTGKVFASGITNSVLIYIFPLQVEPSWE